MIELVLTSSFELVLLELIRAERRLRRGSKRAADVSALACASCGPRCPHECASGRPEVTKWIDLKLRR
jgi:hypothetical protein